MQPFKYLVQDHTCKIKMHYLVDIKKSNSCSSKENILWCNNFFILCKQAFGDGSHKHGSDDSHVEESRLGVMKGLVGLLAIYVFFVMERLVTLFTNSKRKQKKVKDFSSV